MNGVVVTGPHRSGTSALTLALLRAGAYAGEASVLVGPSVSNLFGSTERIDVNALNERLLRSLGGTWDHPNLMPEVTQSMAARRLADTEYPEIRSSLASEARTRGATWCLKDPRFCVIPPDVLQPLTDAHLVVVVRDPYEVARSLATRDGMSLPAGLALWEHYVVGLAALARAFRSSSVVLYHELMARPLETLTTLLSEIDGLSAVSAPFAVAAIRPFLQHERALPTDPSPLTGAQAVLWSALTSKNLPEPASPNAEARQILAAAAERSARATSIRGDQGEREALDRLLSDVAELTSTLLVTEAALHRRQAELEVCDLELSSAKRELDILIAESNRRLVRHSLRLSKGAASYFRWWRSRGEFTGLRRRVNWLAYGAWVIYRLAVPLRVRLLVPRSLRNASESALQQHGVPVVEIRTASIPAQTSSSHGAIDPVMIDQSTEAGADASAETWCLPTPVVGHASSPPPPEQRFIPPVFATYSPQFVGIADQSGQGSANPPTRRAVSTGKPRITLLHRPRTLAAHDPAEPATVQAHSQLARDAGVDGFMVYTYRFGGRPLLDSPIRQIADDSVCDRSFFGCWVNEDWKRRWHRLDEDVLLDVDNSHGGLIDAWNDLIPYIASSRYFRVRARPVFGIYRPSLLAEGWWEVLHDLLMPAGASPPVLALVEEPLSVDSVTNHPEIQRLLHRGDAFIVGFPSQDPAPPVPGIRAALMRPASARNLSNLDLLEDVTPIGALPHQYAPGVSAGWGDTPQHAHSHGTVVRSTPSQYGRRLVSTLTWASVPRQQSPFVLIRGWNEWAEGAVLEPDADEGHARLHASRDAIIRVTSQRRGAGWMSQAWVSADPAPAVKDAVIVHAYYPELLGELIEAAGDARDLPWFVTTGPSERLHKQCRQILEEAGISNQVRPVVNRGRDIWPFLQLLPELSMLGITRFIKVHTKRSPHRVDGDRWRRDLLIDVFDLWGRDRLAAGGDERQGMLIPKRHAITLLSNMGHNASLLAAVQQRAGTRIEIRSDHQFAGGSMFLGSVGVFAGLAARLAFWADDFPVERGQIDGTLAHALERSWGLLLEAEGSSVAIR